MKATECVVQKCAVKLLIHILDMSFQMDRVQMAFGTALTQQRFVLYLWMNLKMKDTASTESYFKDVCHGGRRRK